MALRKLPDGSVLDMETGDLLNYDPAREAAGRRISEAAGQIRPRSNQPTRPIPNRGQQITPVVEFNTIQGKQHLLQPRKQETALNPFELGLGTMSDGTKRMLLTGAIVAAAFGAVWLNSKLNKKKAG